MNQNAQQRLLNSTTLRLYPSLLAFLLRLSSIRCGKPSEIAKRTKQVLDQFERNEDQQQFILTIFSAHSAHSVQPARRGRAAAYTRGG